MPLFLAATLIKTALIHHIQAIEKKCSSLLQWEEKRVLLYGKKM